jgi:hypothetical protein
MDVAGTALAQNYVWTFTTAAGPIITPPTVLSTIPLLGASSVPLNQIVSATFSKAMNPATITTITPPTFTLTYVASGGVTTPVAGLVAYAAIGDTLTFTPAANLAPSTLFTATITTGAQDLTGTALASNYVWTFTTGTVLATTPPELVSTVPANAAIKVPLNQAISATFTEAMDPLSITTASFQLTQGITPIAGTVSYDAINFIATFTPTSPLLASKVYTATVTNGATSATGIPLGTSPTPPFTNPWNFTTGAAVVPPPIVLGGTIALFGGASGGAGMTNTGISTVIHGDAGTTATGFSNFTGFHDDTTMLLGVAQCVYTETPLAVGLVTGGSTRLSLPPFRLRARLKERRLRSSSHKQLWEKLKPLTPRFKDFLQPAFWQRSWAALRFTPASTPTQARLASRREILLSTLRAIPMRLGSSRSDQRSPLARPRLFEISS